MSSRAMRKRRHREDFTQYAQSKKQWKNIASQWKMFGFPNEVAFMKALIAHQQKQGETHVHDENCHHDVEEHVHGENCDHDHDHHEDVDAHEAAQELAQQELRQTIDESYAADRAVLDFLPESNHE